MAGNRVFLSGPMGSGKSVVGQALARYWGTSPVDLDAYILERTGRSPMDWIEGSGTQAFREVEASMLREVLADPQLQVVSLGGGALLEEGLRRAVLDAGTVITLAASVETLRARVGDAADRPLLRGDVGAKLERLLAERQAAYAECHASIVTDDLDPEAVAIKVDAVVSAAPLVVPLGMRTYRVEVGPGVRQRLAERVAGVGRLPRVVLVTDEGVREPWAQQAEAALTTAGHSVTMVCLPQGEEHKHVAGVERIWDAALDAGVDRQSLVLAVGGGVVGDMAGFAAATLLRGVAFAQVPTTLLAMVDSAVGGKTGFDRRQGKNLVGAFHQPRFVLCDVEALGTLPLAERRAGLAEVVKSAWLDGEESVAMLEASAEALVAGDLRATTAAVRMSVSLKAHVVTRDEHESGDRALLNLGHTLGHAIEVAADYKGLRHGEAVALGMVAAFRVAERLGHGSAAHSARMTRLLERLGLPVGVDEYLDEKALAFVGSDKKRAEGKVRFIVPGAPGDTRIEPLALEQLAGLVMP